MNTEFKKYATNGFEKNFYKLMNNAVFGKTMKSVRKRIDRKMVRSDEREKIRKLIASPLFARCTQFTNNLTGVSIHRDRVKLEEPVYVGMTIPKS